MADQSIAIGGISDPGPIRVKILASGREEHTPLLNLVDVASAASNTKMARETKTSLAAKTIPASVDAILLIGDAAAGDDNDGDPVLLVRDPSATVGYLPDAAATKFAYLSRTIKLSKAFHGADPLGVSNNSAALISAVAELMSKGGGKLIIPNGDYKFTAGGTPAILTQDLEIEFAPDAWLIAGTGLATSVLNLRASLTAATERKLRIYNPQIDCTAGSSGVPGVAACTALATQYFQQVLIEGGYLYGGEEPDNVNADSGWTPIADIYARMEGTRVRGFNDVGVYATGNNTVGAVGDGFEVMLRDVTIERCNNAANTKRELSLMTLDSCTINECTAGALTAEVASPFTGPGRRLDVFNTRFKKVTANVIRWRGPSKGSAIGNTIEDYGYAYDGTGSVGAAAYAIVIQGASGINVKQNEIKLVDWVRDDHRAIRLENVTLDAVPYTQGSHHFEGNTYRGLARYIVEAASGNPSQYENEIFDDMSGVKFNSLHVGSYVTYRNIGEGFSRARLNAVDYTNRQRVITASAAGVTLTADDTGGYYTNAGATGLATFNLPTAVLGLTFEFSCMDIDGLRVVAAAGDVIRSAGVASAVAGRIDNAVVGTYIKLTAVDATNWVAEGALGTWTVT